MPESGPQLVQIGLVGHKPDLQHGMEPFSSLDVMYRDLDSHTEPVQSAPTRFIPSTRFAQQDVSTMDMPLR